LAGLLAIAAALHFSGARRTERSRAVPGEASGEASGAESRTESGSDGSDAAEENEPFAAWTVTVLDRKGQPLKGISLRANTDRLAVTDAAGRASFARPPRAEWLEVEDSLLGKKHILREPHTRIRLEAALPLEIRFVEAATGKPLEGGSARLEPLFGEPIPSPMSLAAATLHRRKGASSAVFKLSPPTGFAAERGYRHIVGVEISEFADRLLAEIPLFPELDLSARVLDSEGAPVAGATAGPVQWDESVIHVRAAESDSYGRLRIHGVPFLPESEFTIQFHRGQQMTFVVARIRADEPALELTAMLEKLLLADLQMEMDEIDEEEEKNAAWTGRLEVFANRSNGGPAAGALLRMASGNYYALHRLNGNGSCAVENLEGGIYELHIADPGFVPLDFRVEVSEGVTSRADITEPEGWTARVRVLDRNSHPVPGARIRARYRNRHGRGYAKLDDDLQVVGFFTDCTGEVLLPNLGRERIEFTASLGSRERVVLVEPPDFPEVVVLALP